MRTFFAVICTVLGLTFGGVGVANATTVPAAPSAPATTTLADNDNTNNDNDSGKYGLFGLVGLLGLGGLLGLRRRNDADRGLGAGTGTIGAGGNVPPRV
ncbi:LPXTG cell wall anchor domain-containing protein [Mycobacterium sp.]|jgi:LPXTG-motif cell wall-anchored protein|uniref:LPXTG cell wall anchor domain-containing protein n=1 Tax=Mycobacterium sp. TaxID=1785 RepID=UPI002D40FAE5|nr:LPXTG cell wall anchor domain-containing protein [Mycobacterium sp.]HZA09126.1 LPXTG cell wall anchor domain-containing protein [Mycobacterium sp.]